MGIIFFIHIHIYLLIALTEGWITLDLMKNTTFMEIEADRSYLMRKRSVLKTNFIKVCKLIAIINKNKMRFVFSPDCSTVALDALQCTFKLDSVGLRKVDFYYLCSLDVVRFKLVNLESFQKSKKPFLALYLRSSGICRSNIHNSLRDTHFGSSSGFIHLDCLRILCSEKEITFKLSLSQGCSGINNRRCSSQSQKQKKLYRIKKAAFINSFSFLNSRNFITNVLEEQPQGLILDINISSVHPNSNNTRKLVYSLLALKDQRSQSLFEINPLTGKISTTQNLDRETMPTHFFKILVQESGKPEIYDEANLTIYVKDINDHEPKFDRMVYAKVASENIVPGSELLTVQAMDEDSDENGEVTYVILNAEELDNLFKIDPRFGVITTTSILDRETKEFYTLKILAVDNAKSSIRFSSSCMVEITLQDENDNYPQFINASYYFEIMENVYHPGMSIVGRIWASDADLGSNGCVRYAITSGNSFGHFSIDPDTGTLSINGPLDYENIKTYKLLVRAQDLGTPSKSNTTSITINVLDSNDNEPNFDVPFYHNSIYENVPVGFSVLKVRAYDADSGSYGMVRYFIPSNYNIPFMINEDGNIVTTMDIDREIQSLYKFDVLACDFDVAEKCSKAMTEITIMDVNDNSPKFEQKVYNSIVMEDSKPGSIVETVKATDADEDTNGRIIYKIASGNEGGFFNLVTQIGHGILSISKVLSYRQQNHYKLVISASDSVFEDRAIINISVLHVNLHRPIFLGTPYQIRLHEDISVGQVIYSVSAFDADFGDNSKISYFLHPNDTFSINESTGEVNLSTFLDRETKAGYTLTVTAIDHGQPQKLDFADIEVVVVDSNDNSPKFLKNHYYASISEDALAGTHVLAVQASDADEGENKKIKYLLEDNDDFKIDSSLGIIRTTKELDREKTPNYNLIAFAIDGGKPPRTGSTHLRIIVEDINDNAPVFEAACIEFYVKENVPLGFCIGEIKAFDLDEGFNALIHFFILPEHDSEAFALEHFDNRTFLISATEFDFESVKKELIVRVRAKSNHLFTDTLIKVFIVDVNDNMPILKDFDIIFNNYKDHFNLGYIGVVPAHDLDVSDKLKYKIVYGNQGHLLHLNETTGVMKLDSRLNSDVPTNATLIISVTDGINEVRATCKLYVRLVTEEILHNSIKIQIELDEKFSFFGVAYKMLILSLAAMVSSPSEDVFIINIQDQSSLIGSNLLVISVTFAIRCYVGPGGDEFFSQAFLKYKFHMFKPTLMKQSFLKILPFEDDACLQEPCLNFEVCSSVLKFDGSSDIISSDSMFFRPIRTTNIFTCHCPEGFTEITSNYLCDVELNLCFSNPCANNGTCLQTEGGYQCICMPNFRGSRCEDSFFIDTIEACQKKICKHPSICVSTDGGRFRCQLCNNGECQNCGDLPGYDELCEVVSRSFEEGSYLMFPPIEKRHRFNITLRFATNKRDGLLLYNGRFNGNHDFILLQVKNKQLQFSFSLGSQITTLNTYLPNGTNVGQWIDASITYYNKSATMVVGKKCDNSKLNARSCSASVSQVLEQRCEDATEICYRFLDLNGPLLVGGLPSSEVYNQSIISTSHFTGCISNLYMDQKPIDLNSFISQNATGIGCTYKLNFCSSNPCLNEGNCTNAWGGFKCDCPNRFAGKNCNVLETYKDQSMKLFGNSSISFVPVQHRLHSIKFPWFVAFYIRTTQSHSTIFHMKLFNEKLYISNIDVTIELADGHIKCVIQNSTFQLDQMVNDGFWHHFLVSLDNRQLIFDIDFGTFQLSYAIENEIVGYHIEKIVFGGRQGTGEKVLLEGFKGCIKSIRFSNSNSFDDVFLNGTKNNIQPGCKALNMCMTNLHGCHQNSSKCINMFDSFRCECNPGYAGPFCEKTICEAYEPCNIKFSKCVMDVNSPYGYNCICGNKQCHGLIKQKTPKCPPSWWGSPICGPCNCLSEKGYSTNCDPQTGRCFCKPNHYLKGLECFPCDCYAIGSLSVSCDAVTGQCPCHTNVVGRRCDTCTNKMAQVTAKGCVEIGDGCPRSFKKNIWWDTSLWNAVVTMSCPLNMIGTATRYCNESSGWSEPDMKNCSSVAFYNLNLLLEALDSERLELNAFVSKDILSRLKKATDLVEHMTIIDIYVTQKILKKMLIFESKQEGLDMVHSQDRHFIQNLVDVVGEVLDIRYFQEWKFIHLQNPDAALALASSIYTYLNSLTANMQQLFTPSFDAVHNNFMLGLDWIGDRHAAAYIKLPKFDNKLKQQMVLDFHTQMHFPVKALPFHDGETTKVYVYYGYVMFKTLGIIMPLKYDDKLRKRITSLSVINSTILNVCVINGTSLKPVLLDMGLVVEFGDTYQARQRAPKCVVLAEGMWTEKGCKLTVQDSVTCTCNTISTYAIIAENVIQELNLKPFTLDVASYIVLGISTIFHFVAFCIFVFIKIMTTKENVVFLNLSANTFLFFSVILISIDRVANKELCRIAAIFLHFFWLNCHSWMFLKFYHLYKRIANKDVNHGSTQSLYFIGYVFPGVIVSLSVGLNTEAYGCKFFCWLPQGSTLSWAYVAPLVCYALLSLIALLLSTCLVIKRRSHFTDGHAKHFKYRLLTDCTMLILLHTSSVLLNLSINYAWIYAFKYLFLAFSLIQSTFFISAYIAFHQETKQQIVYIWYKTIFPQNVYKNRKISKEEQKAQVFKSDGEVVFANQSSEQPFQQVPVAKLVQSKLKWKSVSSDFFSENINEEKSKKSFIDVHWIPTLCFEEREISTAGMKTENSISSEEEMH